MEKGKILLKLFLTYFKIGLFTFGGGYAMIAMIEHEFVERKKWISKMELLDIVAIAESTPGPIAINCATYIGYKMGKIWGSLVATFAVVLPSFIIIFILSFFIDWFLGFKYIQMIFSGFQVGVAFLIMISGIKMAKSANKDLIFKIVMPIALVSILCVELFGLGISVIYFILTAMIIGTIYAFVSNKKGGDQK